MDYKTWVELQNKVLHPREFHTTGSEAAASLFIQGLAADLAASNGGNESQIFKAETLYQAAFDAGSVEAGVNLLRLFFTTTFHECNHATESYNMYVDVQSKLATIQHPIIPYYDAMLAIDGSLDSEDLLKDMKQLAQAGNPYAVTYMALAKHYDVLDGPFDH